jgi:hypothetical protein
MMIVALDPHAHLYDSFSIPAWIKAALKNLRVEGSKEGANIGPTTKCVSVVDRAGQDTFARFRKELSDVASWEEWSGDIAGWRTPLIASITLNQGEEPLYVLRGVQYVSVERIEVLGLGVDRRVEDCTLAAWRLIELINSAGGVACLPWSPGKWLGARGRVVAQIIASGKSGGVCLGDIALRSSLGVPAMHLRRGAATGFRVLAGSDPLPIDFDEGLVGSYGVCFNIQGREISGLGELYSNILTALRSEETECKITGGGYGPLKGMRRYLGDRVKARLRRG